MVQQLRIESPDFAGLLKGKGRAIHDAVRLLWAVQNDTLKRLSRVRPIWQTQSYDSSLFAASAGTWTVASADQLSYTFILLSTLMIIAFEFENTATSGGMGSQLLLRLPQRISAAGSGYTGVIHCGDNIDEVGRVVTRASPNQDQLSLERAAGSNWPDSAADDLDIRGAILLEID